jgi:hypothetical protein
MRTATIETTRHESAPRDVVRREASVIVLSSAELAECTCPDACDRDHDRD